MTFDPNFITFGSKVMMFGPNFMTFGSNFMMFGSNVMIFSVNVMILGPNFMVSCPNVLKFSVNFVTFGSDAAVFGAGSARAAPADRCIAMLVAVRERRFALRDGWVAGSGGRVPPNAILLTAGRFPLAPCPINLKFSRTIHRFEPTAPRAARAAAFGEGAGNPGTGPAAPAGHW